MDVPNLVLNLGQIRRDALNGLLSVEQLLDIIEKQQQNMKRLVANAHLPSRLVHVNDGGMSNQGTQRVELVVPILRQLPQQGVRLRFGQRQLIEESQHGTGFVQGDANGVHQEGGVASRVPVRLPQR